MEKEDIITYPVHADFKLLFYGVDEYLEQLEAFLTHINSFIKLAEEKLNKPTLYTNDCFEYFHAASYGDTFRGSFIVTICSISESFVKEYIEKCATISKNNLPGLRKEGVMDYLKLADKEYFKIGIDFNDKDIIDFKGLLALRNSIVHSSSTFDDVQKYKPQIIQLAKKFGSIEILKDKYIYTSEEFCRTSIVITRRFFYYIVKLAIRRHYAYVSEKEYAKHEEKNCR